MNGDIIALFHDLIQISGVSKVVGEFSMSIFFAHKRIIT